MPITQEGEAALDITNLGYFSGYFYSSTVSAMGALIHAAHVHGRHPTRGLGQEVIYMMTCSTLSNPEDMKLLLRGAITLITTANQAEDEYAALQFFLAPGEQGTPGAYLLLGLSPGSRYHMCLRDILLIQPDSGADSSTGPQPLHPPPVLANPDGVSLEGQWDTHTP